MASSTRSGCTQFGSSRTSASINLSFLACRSASLLRCRSAPAARWARSGANEAGARRHSEKRMHTLCSRAALCWCRNSISSCFRWARRFLRSRAPHHPQMSPAQKKRQRSGAGSARDGLRVGVGLCAPVELGLLGVLRHDLLPLRRHLRRVILPHRRQLRLVDRPLLGVRPARIDPVRRRAVAGEPARAVGAGGCSGHRPQLCPSERRGGYCAAESHPGQLCGIGD